VTVPALRGYPLPQAQAALVKTGLKFRTIYRTNAAAPGTVIDSDPAEGQQVPPDTTVTLVVAQSATTLPTAPITVTPGR
jgi:beta-lactam-binding protein with PASTA domain